MDSSATIESELQTEILPGIENGWLRSRLQARSQSFVGFFGKVRSRSIDHLRPLRATDELWRYTKPEQFDWSNLIKAKDGNVSFSWRVGSSQEGATLPAGVSISREAGVHMGLVQSLFDSYCSDIAYDPVSNLQTAICDEPLYVIVKRDTVIKDPLSLSHHFSDLLGSAATTIVIIVERGASLTLIENVNESRYQGFFAPRFECLLLDNSKFEFVSAQQLGEKSNYLARHRFHLMRDASLKTVHVGIGSRVSRVDLDCRLHETGAHAELNGLYLGAGDQHLDFHPTQDHLAPHCRSDLYCKGALLDTARSVYFGFVKVAEQAQKTDAYQTNRNLLLSPDARADAIPNLEIKANDVKCSHGASVGQVGADELFYLMSRGLSRNEAERLLVQGFFEDLLSRISDPRTQEFVSEEVRARLYRRSVS